MKNILILLFALLLFSACKKEKKIERNLWNNGGKWDIVKYEEIVTSTWPANEKNDVYENYGMMQFNRAGSGWMIHAEDYDAYKYDFRYSNTPNELTIKYHEFDDSDTYTLDWKKNSFTLTQSGTSTYSPSPSDPSFTVTDHRLYRYTCEKQ
ncbi:hypothetical protein CW751_00430 [Brumimicrobium salinarum]|uniref:Lipocalin-like domain-containing protein n=1 Tax=Brumimicrobium salinarum TaxID=2058658 RepID=A0A2I0R5L0_9FLAO|nr:hypothetical protein [Brumimicrobium salinarum]PKR81839.1 hypothetical protein CW751_00430 [Brumimicrobium salinarum]